MRAAPPLLLLALALVALTTRAADLRAGWAPNLTATATWQDNLSNADRRSDRLGALVLSADLAASTRRGLSAADTLLLGAHLAGESAPRFDALDRATAGASLTWQHKPGLGPTASVWSATLATDALVARDAARSGFAAALTVTWRRRLDADTLLRFSTELSRLDACGAVYDRSAVESTAAVTRSLTSVWQLGAFARLRFGDVLAYATPPRSDLVALARARTNVTTFDRPMVAYTFSARTVAAGLDATCTLDERTSLLFAAEYRVTDKSSFRYVNRLVSAALARQF